MKSGSGLQGRTAVVGFEKRSVGGNRAESPFGEKGKLRRDRPPRRVPGEEWPPTHPRGKPADDPPKPDRMLLIEIRLGSFLSRRPTHQRQLPGRKLGVVVLQRREQVAVGIERDLDATVAHQCLDLLRREPLVDGPRCKEVTQRVEAVFRLAVRVYQPRGDL